MRLPHIMNLPTVTVAAFDNQTHSGLSKVEQGNSASGAARFLGKLFEVDV